MSGIWGSVLGDHLWLLLRGEDFLDPEPRKLQTISHQHILPPNARTRPSARDICLKLLHACAARMRKEGLWAGGIAVQVSYYGLGYVFQNQSHFFECQDTITLQEHFLPLWETSPCHTPASINVSLTHLLAMPNLDLFSPSDEMLEDRIRVTAALDQLNRRNGHHSVYLGSIHNAREEAPNPHPVWATTGAGGILTGLAERSFSKPTLPAIRKSQQPSNQSGHLFAVQNAHLVRANSIPRAEGVNTFSPDTRPCSFRWNTIEKLAPALNSLLAIGVSVTRRELLPFLRSQAAMLD